MADDKKQRRYVRCIWHPVKRHVFAVATDANDVLVVDIMKLLEGRESANFKESEISGKFLKTDRHEEVSAIHYFDCLHC